MSTEKKRDRASQRRVRERQAKTGESYQAAWRQLTGSEAPGEDPPPLTPATIAKIQAGWRVLTGSEAPGEDPPPQTSGTIDPEIYASTRRIFLPLNLPQVLPQQRTRVTARAQQEAVDVSRIFISGATEGGAADWVVNDIEVDGRSQLALKDLSGALFGTSGVAANPKGLTTFMISGFDTVEYDHEVSIVVTYIGENPEGAPFFAAAIGSPPPQRPTVVPIASSAPLPISKKTTIGARIQDAPFQMSRLEVEEGSDWIVNDLRINGRTQFDRPGIIPGDFFDNKAIDTFVSLGTCPAGAEIELDVTYDGKAASAIFKCRLEGTVVRDDRSSPPPDLRIVVRTGDVIAGEVIATCDWRPPPPMILDEAP